VITQRNQMRAGVVSAERWSKLERRTVQAAHPPVTSRTDCEF